MSPTTSEFVGREYKDGLEFEQLMESDVVSILPVLDLKDGLIVRGIAGQRAKYRPIESHLCCNPRPASVAQAFVSNFAFRLGYVADLDAIAGKSPSWDTYQAIADCGLKLMIDAGVDSMARATLLGQFAAANEWLDGIILGLESAGSRELVREMMSFLGTRLAIFGLDLQHGKPLTSIESWRTMAPLEIAREVISFGVRRMIVLDLASVGTGEGPTTMALCRELRDSFPYLELISGGGIRGAADVLRLLNSGCDRVLVASALHDGRLMPHEIAHTASSRDS